MLLTLIGINVHFWHTWRHLLCNMTSSIISSLSILNIWWRGGLTALFKGSCSSQLLINRVVSCTCDLSFVPTRVEMATWTKHDKDIDSPILVPRHIRAIRVRGRRLGNSPNKLNSWGHIRNCRGRLGTRLRFSIFFTARHARQFQREQPQARILNGLEVFTSCLQMRVKYAVKLKRD